MAEKINDTMGHAFGDKVLSAIGHGIKGEFRVSDIIGRIGGDEFMVFLKNINSDTKNKIAILLSDFKDDIKTETDTENLISAKTGSQCLVVINDGTCQVILEKNTLNDLLILQITEIIEKNTEISSENLTIVPIFTLLAGLTKHSHSLPKIFLRSNISI